MRDVIGIQLGRKISWFLVALLVSVCFGVGFCEHCAFALPGELTGIDDEASNVSSVDLTICGVDYDQGGSEIMDESGSPGKKKNIFKMRSVYDGATGFTYRVSDSGGASDFELTADGNNISLRRNWGRYNGL